MNGIEQAHHNRALAVALVLGLAAGLLIAATRSASEEPMPRSARELEAIVWSRVEECHSNDGYLRCPRSLPLSGRGL